MDKSISRVWQEALRLEEMVRENERKLKGERKYDFGIVMFDWKKIKRQGGK